MPIYELGCLDCKKIHIIEQSIHSDPPKSLNCLCGGLAIRIYQATPITFKGSGFYKTDKDNKQ